VVWYACWVAFRLTSGFILWRCKVSFSCTLSLGVVCLCGVVGENWLSLNKKRRLFRVETSKTLKGRSPTLNERREGLVLSMQFIAVVVSFVYVGLKSNPCRFSPLLDVNLHFLTEEDVNFLTRRVWLCTVNVFGCTILQMFTLGFAASECSDDAVAH
jgi:hypothetical protein